MSKAIPTSRSLLGRLRNLDDHESWQDFHNIYSKLILSTALHAGLTETEAQEVLQETLIFTAKKMPGFNYDPAQGSFKSWLLRATKWRITDQLRKRSRFVSWRQPRDNNNSDISMMESIPDPKGSELESIWDAEWDKALLDTALQRIRRSVNYKRYQAFELYALRRWPVQKVAAALGLSVSQVYLAKYRTTALLKRELLRLDKRMI
jgi:RNA polymerase sigma factor (sigma-70 family)